MATGDGRGNVWSIVLAGGDGVRTVILARGPNATVMVYPSDHSIYEISDVNHAMWGSDRLGDRRGLLAAKPDQAREITETGDLWKFTRNGVAFRKATRGYQHRVPGSISIRDDERIAIR